MTSGRCSSVGLALLASLTVACFGGEARDLGPTAPVEIGRIERIVVASGTIEPEKQVEVRTRLPGIVRQVHVAAGDTVTSGTLLVEIDRELLEARSQEAHSRLEASRIERRYARREFERVSALHERGAVAQQGFEMAEARYQTARAAVAHDQATVTSLDVQLRYALVRAPMAGQILDVAVEQGDAVASVASVTGGTRLLTLATAQPLHIEGLVDESEIAHVAIGQPSRVRAEAFPDRVFAGHVRKISPIGTRRENITYFEVEVAIDDPAASLLRPLMSADADIVTQVVEDARLIPEVALLYGGDQIFVERVTKSNEVERREVHIGILENNRVQILDGLVADDRVRIR